MRSGWILDAYPVWGGMCVWLIDESGRLFSHLDPWEPSFYLKAPSSSYDDVKRILSTFKTPFSFHVVDKKEFFTNDLCRVIEVRLQNPLFFKRVTDRLISVPQLSLFNADLQLPELYFYSRGLFPLAFCSWETTKEGNILKWEIRDSAWELDYELPPLRFARLSLDTEANANHRRRGVFLLTLGPQPGSGVTYSMEGSERDMLVSLNRHIADWDPDILLTDWGDSFIMPRLEFYSRHTNIPLLLSRDPQKYMSSGQDRSFFSYGKIHYRAGTRTLFGRIHIDVRNSFMVHHTELDGLVEISRISKIPLQRASRSTIGTCLSSMQYDWAVRENVLIPLDKGQVEEFRPAEDLLASDRGGLVYEPDIGFHEDLIEFDFTSMYPEIMIRHNVTPEAINCACCPHNKVPEISHHICEKRIGMVPAVLKPLVDKRKLYKELIERNHPRSESFQRRRDAFKWVLVTCFGYLGYRNARFGRIEAHECVNAFSREALLKAKETAEAEGFYFVHAIVDSLWLKKPHATEEDVLSLQRKIEAATGLPLGLEGRYRWIQFFPSKTNPLVGVPNRYLGIFKTGASKVRGIELRRHDTPLFIKNVQQKLINVMSEAESLQDLNRIKEKLFDVVEEARDRLKNGQVTPLELALTKQLSRGPEDYVHDTLSAIAAKKLVASGVPLQPGETIQYVVSEEHDKVKDWRVMPLALIEETFEYDRPYYLRLLKEAIQITPFDLWKEAPKPKDVRKKGRNLNQLFLPGFEEALRIY